MSEIEQPDIRPIEGGKYRLAENYSYYWPPVQGNCRVTIPKGFVYDGASVPQWLWSITGLRPDGLIRAAALVHDFFYRYGGKPPKGTIAKNYHNRWYQVPFRCTRKAADHFFFQIMEDFSMPWLKRTLAYRAVRLCGWYYWREKEGKTCVSL